MKGHSTRERQYYIDWLRAFAVFMLVPFHTAMIFVEWGFHIKNEVRSEALTDFNSFLDMWHMPLLFLLSGAGTWFALGHRSAGQYIKERFRRLFIPLVFGILVIVPPQTYLERVSNHQFQGSYLAFYPHFFEGVYPEGNFTWNHLWFLAYLFVFSMLALPVLAYFRTENGGRAIERVATFFEPRGRLLLLALPIAVTEAALRVTWPGPQTLVGDWANFLFYITVFVYGYFLCSHEKLGRAVARQKGLFLGLAVGCVVVFKTLDVTGMEPAWGYNAGNMALLGTGAFNSWCWVLAFLGFGKTYLDFTNRFLKYATEAVLPFYILHQTVIIIIGFHVIAWNAPVAVKFPVICVASFVCTLLVYELLVKRVNAIRFLFGMKPIRRTSQNETTPAA